MLRPHSQIRKEHEVGLTGFRLQTRENMLDLEDFGSRIVQQLTEVP